MHKPTRSALCALVVLGLFATIACGPARERVTVRIPPRVDLASLEQIGVVEFRSSTENDLGRLATQRFADSARRDQGLVRMVELGTEDDVFRSLGRNGWDQDTYRTLGTERDLRTILIGELTLSKARPSVRVAPDRSGGGRRHGVPDLYRDRHGVVALAADPPSISMDRGGNGA